MSRKTKKQLTEENEALTLTNEKNLELMSCLRSDNKEKDARIQKITAAHKHTVGLLADALLEV
jgi:hypothetical protein